jgi:hypothetical protein
MDSIELKISNALSHCEKEYKNHILNYGIRGKTIGEKITLKFISKNIRRLFMCKLIVRKALKKEFDYTMEFYIQKYEEINNAYLSILTEAFENKLIKEQMYSFLCDNARNICLKIQNYRRCI